MIQDHHHLAQNGIQRNARMGMQQMGPPPNQRTQMLMSMPAAGVLVPMTAGPATIITAQSIPQAQQGKPNIPPQVFHYENAPTSEADLQEQQHQNTNTSSVPNSNLANIKEKTPMCLVNELARYRKIQHQYRLTGEQGPAHKKVFTVKLKLGNEEYEAEGLSIKKAQHSAAAIALVSTKFKGPPRISRNRTGTRPTNSGIVTPTVELNALAMKRGERTVYIVENGAPQHYTQGYIPQPVYYPRQHLYNTQAPPRYGYDARRNLRGHYPHHNNTYYGAASPYHQHQNQSDPCTVRLRVGEREYPGQGDTIQAARHDAAAKAIEHIKQLGGGVEDGGESLSPSEQSEGGKVQMNDSVSSDMNSDLKSPISLVYEIALKRNLDVTFDVINESGPPHMKVFVTHCRVGTFLAEGEGNGKKISKKRAAEKILEELSKLPPIRNMAKRVRVTNKKKTKTRNLIKVNMDKTSKSKAAEEINPISRLIQIQQANKEREPIYTVIEDRSGPRRREFVIEASVNGQSCTGVGPNKKVAKRNAAEALFVMLGYANATTVSVAKPTLKAVEKEVATATNEKSRKVTFVEEKAELQTHQSVGGSGGRQLVPGVLLVTEQKAAFQGKKEGGAGEKAASSQIKSTSAPIQGVRSKDKLLYLAQLMDITVQFSDFPKANHEMYLTLVSLSTNPPQVCHGEGPTTEASHEKAALEALKVLSELGLDIVQPPTKEVPTTTSGDSSTSGTATKAGIQNGVKK